jgi:DNA-binding phage protein
MNIPKLKGKIVEREMNMEQLADAMGIDRSTLYRKMSPDKDKKPEDKITIGDAVKMKEILNLSNDEAYEIFLA